MMRWFGPTDGNPARMDDLERADAPLGQSCMWCDEPILDGEFGVLIDHAESREGGGFIVTPRPHHNECYARQILGSVAHQTGMCTCVDPESPHHDPPGLTKRQAAQAAWRTLFHR